MSGNYPTNAGIISYDLREKEASNNKSFIIYSAIFVVFVLVIFVVIMIIVYDITIPFTPLQRYSYPNVNTTVTG